MALSNDWEWIVILSIYSFLLATGVIAYNSSFNPDGSVKFPNASGNFSCVGSNCTNFNSGYSQASADSSSPGLSFLSSLSFGLPGGLAAIFVTLFEILPGGLLLILIFRQFRSGGG